MESQADNAATEVGEADVEPQQLTEEQKLELEWLQLTTNKTDEALTDE